MITNYQINKQIEKTNNLVLNVLASRNNKNIEFVFLQSAT